MRSDHAVARIRAATEELTGVRSVVSGAGDAEPTPSTHRMLLVVSVMSVVALLVGLLALGTSRRDDVRSGPDDTWSSMVVEGDVGAWLDLPGAPVGLRRSADLGLAATSVCLDARSDGEQLRCTALEGQIAAVYVPTSAPTNADETLDEIEIRTLFTDADVGEFARSLIPTDDADTVAVTVRGHDGYSVRDDERGATILVWSDRRGTINTLRVTLRSGLDPFALADSLESRAWPPDVRPPLAAVDLSLVWRARDNNHPYALATTSGSRDCISVGFIRDEGYDDGLTACTVSSAVWTIGTVTNHADPAQRALSDIDVIAGLVPPSVTTVRFQGDDGRLIEVPTVVVNGLRNRAFGFATGSPQGTLVVGELTGFGDGVEQFSEPVVAMMPTVSADAVCDVPGATHIIPDVVGSDLRTAERALRDAGIIAASPVASDTMPVVATLDPPAGTDRFGCGDVILGFEP